jgi:hypothetical protein
MTERRPDMPRSDRSVIPPQSTLFVIPPVTEELSALSNLGCGDRCLSSMRLVGCGSRGLAT